MQSDSSDEKYPLSDITYKILGASFKVQNYLGNSLDEKYYQRALESEFRAIGLRFVREKQVDLIYNGDKIGRHALDFIIEDKVVLETKTIPNITTKSLTQLLAYLKSTGLRIGILINFRTDKLTYRRVINPLIR